MLQSMGPQRVRHDSMTEQQQGGSSGVGIWELSEPPLQLYYKSKTVPQNKILKCFKQWDQRVQNLCSLNICGIYAKRKSALLTQIHRIKLYSPLLKFLCDVTVQPWGNQLDMRRLSAESNVNFSVWFGGLICSQELAPVRNPHWALVGRVSPPHWDQQKPNGT